MYCQKQLLNVYPGLDELYFSNAGKLVQDTLTLELLKFVNPLLPFDTNKFILCPFSDSEGKNIVASDERISRYLHPNASSMFANRLNNISLLLREHHSIELHILILFRNQVSWIQSRYLSSMHNIEHQSYESFVDEAIQPRTKYVPTMKFSALSKEIRNKGLFHLHVMFHEALVLTPKIYAKKLSSVLAIESKEKVLKLLTMVQKRLIDWEFILRLTENRSAKSIPCVLSKYFYNDSIC